MAGEVSAGSGDAEHFFAKKFVEKEYDLDIFGSVSSLSTGSSDWVEKAFEFFFPVAEGVDFNASDLTGEADAHSFIRFTFPLAHSVWSASLSFFWGLARE